MPQIKSHKTVEQIAKKHRLDVSFIQKQLDMGEPIEHEHTKDHELAKDIALQHLDEIPDYYTRLKKMEASAKKEHKKFKDVKEGNLHKWFQDSKSKDGKPGWVNVVTGGTCASDEPGEGTPKCVSSSKRASMTQAERLSASKRKKAADPGQQKKSNAAKPTYVSTDKPKKMQEQSFTIDVAGHKTAQRQQKIRNLATGTNNPNEKSAAQRKLSGPSLPLADEYVIEDGDKKGAGSGKKDACYHKVKSRYSVWPSAYASGALVKCRRVGADNWGTKSEETHPVLYGSGGQEERYCPLCQKRETRSECSYGGKAWDRVSIKDHEYSMVRSELETLMKAAKRLKAKVERGEGSLEAWVQSKITKASDYIDTAADYVDSGEMQEQLNIDEKCWTGYKKKGMKTMFGKRYPNCVKTEDVTIEDANGNTFAEVIDLIKPEPIRGFKSQMNEATRLQSQTGNIIAATLSWKGKHYSLKMFFPQVNLPSRKDISDEIQKVYPGSILVYHSISEIKPGQPLFQPCGPEGGSAAKPGSNKNYVKPMGEEVEIDEDWQSVNRKDRTDGLSQKAVNAYRRENPGSKLQTAVTEKNPSGKRAQRRKNFCSRMSGMKKRLTSAETARDPDSRINKALRRWNCN